MIPIFLQIRFISFKNKLVKELFILDNTSITQTEIVNKLNSIFKENFDQLISEIIKICEIPAPTFEEDARGNYVLEKLSNIQKLAVHKDKFKNVIIRYPGKEKKAKIAILAHLDTVFSFSEIKVERSNLTLSAPGIGDNSTSVAVLLHIIESWNTVDYTPPFDVIFVTNSCEEGLGDLKGVKGFIDEYCSDSLNNVELKTLLSIDGTLERITHIGTGVKRYKIEVVTKGGHSWANFGEVESAIHIIGNIIADITHIKVPESPKTTYNVGLVEGGTSINTIAESASILVDLRSTSEIELNRLDHLLQTIVNFHTKDKKDITVKSTIVGNRPSGRIPFDHPLMTVIQKSANESGLKFTPSSGMASTDANIPLSRNIPAVAFGCYSGSGAHTNSESIVIDSLKRGVPFTNLAIINTIDWLQDYKEKI